MKKNNLKRFLASLLAVLMLSQVTGVAPGVFAEEAYEQPILQNGEAVVFSNADEATVKQVLAKALIANYDKCDPSTRDNLDWQYYCKSETYLNKTKTEWVSVNGHSYWDKIYKYEFKSLAKNSNGTYDVRLKDAETQVQFTKLEPKQSSIALTDYADGIKVPYNSDGSVNYATLKERILDKVVTNPVDVDRSSITIEYSASPDLSKLGENAAIDQITKWAGKEWTPLEGGSHKVIGIDVPYFAMTAGENKIKLSWGGDDTYYGCSSEFTVNFLDRDPAPLQRNDVSEIGIVYNDDLSVNYEATKDAIRNALATSTDAEIVKTSDLNVEYQTLTSYEDFGSDADIKPGTEKTIRLSWNGNADYSAWKEIFDVTFVDGREASSISFKENPVVKITYNDQIQIDFDKLYTAIWNNVVENTDPALTVNDVKITYYATAKTGAVGDLGHNWSKLEGEKLDGLTYPAISEGTWTLRFEYAGSANYTAFSQEVAVNFVGRDPAFEIIPGVTQVDMKFADATNYDYESTANAIREAVVKKLADDESINLSDVTVEYKDSIKFKTLDKDADLKTGKEYTFRLSWGGSKGTAMYKPFSEEVKLTLVDNRLASSVSIIDKAGITYNMNASEMENAIFNSVINWDASELPAKDTLTVGSFVIEYYATAQFEAGDTTTKLPEDVAQAWVPIGGMSKTVDLSIIGLGKIGIVYPQMGAGEQQIRIRFIGSADYKPSEVEAALSVAKADVKVNVKRPVITMHAGDKDLPEGSITLTPDDKSIDVYTVFAGITSKIGGKVTTSVYLDLPDRYTTDNKLLTAVLDPLFKSVIGRTFTEVLQDGITVGELKQLAAKASEVADKLGKIGIDVESFTKLMNTIANLPGIVDDMRIAIGTPNHAGIYQAFVITNNVNYNTAYGTGTVLVLKQYTGISLVKNSAFDANGGKITVTQANEIANSVCILSNDKGESVGNEAQGAIRYLFTGIKDSHGLYSSSKMPNEPGRYIVTATVVGGDFFAFPKTFSFTIVADPTPES